MSCFLLEIRFALRVLSRIDKMNWNMELKYQDTFLNSLFTTLTWKHDGSLIADTTIYLQKHSCLQHILYLHLLLSIIKGLFGYGLTLLLLFVIYDNLRHTNGLWKTFGWQACIYHFLFFLGLPYLNGIGGLTGWVSL
ncbi:hypothetical protein ACJX0J_020922, partial [Zea mays]